MIIFVKSSAMNQLPDPFPLWIPMVNFVQCNPAFNYCFLSQPQGVCWDPHEGVPREGPEGRSPRAPLGRCPRAPEGRSPRAPEGRSPGFPRVQGGSLAVHSQGNTGVHSSEFTVRALEPLGRWIIYKIQCSYDLALNRTLACSWWYIIINIW